MPRIGRLACVLIALVALPAVAAVQTDDARLWQALREGRAAALMRHAYAPGVGDPEDFRLDDCNTQRNLSVEGAIQAQETGELFRAQGIGEAEIRSSQWCRCRQTGEWLELGPVEPMPALNSLVRNGAQAPERTATVRRFLAERTSTRPLVLVTHQVNIRALVGTSTGSGEIVVIALPASLQAELEIIGRIPPPR